MTGARPGGFGALNNRTFQICAPGDLICAAPQSAFNITNLPQTLGVLAGGAGAPAFLKRASPAGGTAGAAPGEVVIDFTEGVEPQCSTIAVTAAGFLSMGNRSGWRRTTS